MASFRQRLHEVERTDDECAAGELGWVSFASAGTPPQARRRWANAVIPGAFGQTHPVRSRRNQFPNRIDAERGGRGNLERGVRSPIKKRAGRRRPARLRLFTPIGGVGQTLLRSSHHRDFFAPVRSCPTEISARDSRRCLPFGGADRQIERTVDGDRAEPRVVHANRREHDLSGFAAPFLNGRSAGYRQVTHHGADRPVVIGHVGNDHANVLSPKASPVTGSRATGSPQ